MKVIVASGRPLQRDQWIDGWNMDSLELGGPAGKVVLKLIERVEMHLPSAGDLFIAVDIALDNCQVGSTAWIGKNDVLEFGRSLEAFLDYPVGSPQLRGISPESLSLSIMKMNDRGGAFIKVAMTGPRARFSVTAEVESDLSQLANLAAWLRLCLADA